MSKEDVRRSLARATFQRLAKEQRAEKQAEEGEALRQRYAKITEAKADERSMWGDVIDPLEKLGIDPWRLKAWINS